MYIKIVEDDIEYFIELSLIVFIQKNSLDYVVTTENDYVYSGNIEDVTFLNKFFNISAPNNSTLYFNLSNSEVKKIRFINQIRENRWTFNIPNVISGIIGSEFDIQAWERAINAVTPGPRMIARKV